MLGGEELAAIHAYWRAANYLSVGQIYLLDNPLLREPLSPSTTWSCSTTWTASTSSSTSSTACRGSASARQHLRQAMVDERRCHRAYTRATGDDAPDVRDWTWPGDPDPVGPREPGRGTPG